MAYKIEHAYVILENHMQLVAQSPSLKKEIASFKSYTARQLIDYLKQKMPSAFYNSLIFFKKQHKKDRQYQDWEEGCHPEQIQSETMLRQKNAQTKDRLHSKTT